MSYRVSSARSPFLLALLVFGLMVAQCMVTGLAYNEGYFGYSLDDPYIHLALAKNLAQGHYGLNPGEVCAPSSSILWPFLLVPGVWLGIAVWFPLLINLAAGGGVLWVGHQLLRLALEQRAQEKRVRVEAILLVSLIFATNLTGIVIMGMEHTLHLFLSLAVVLGLARERKEGRPPLWLAGVLVLVPLVRYEGLALMVGSVLYLLARRHYRVAAVALILTLALLGGFTAFLVTHNLGYLPTSIGAKARIHYGRPFYEVLWRNFQMNTVLPEAVQLVVLTTLVLRGSARKTWRGLLLLVGGCGVVHLFLGSFGWFARYEIYAVGLLLAALVLNEGPVLLRRHPLALAGMGALVSILYLPPTLESSEATNDIYLQQYQMQRLVQLWDGPVAVNDIGWISLTSRHYVLDLYGLANREAVLREKQEPLSVWTQDLVERHHVKLAMLYNGWFAPERVPASWIQVGTLEVARPKIVLGSAQVTLWAMDAAAAERLRTLLPHFAKRLPNHAFVRLADGTLLTREGTTLPELARG